MAERIRKQIHERKGSSSSSDSDNDKPVFPSTNRKKHLFGRKQPLHTAFGGGLAADVVLWRNKVVSGGILAAVTVVWLLFEWMGYHMITFVCHVLILVIIALFVWSNVASFVNRSPPNIPVVILSEEKFLRVARSVRNELNEAFTTFHFIAAGEDSRKFMMVTSGLWIVSVIGGWFNFLTLCYLVFMALFSLPALYERYEAQVDAAAEKAMIEVKKQYAVLNANVLQKIPRGPFSSKKQR